MSALNIPFQKGKYTLLKNATLFDGFSNRVHSNHSVLIKDDVIYTVAPDSQICIPENAKIITLDGRLISPGLIESHGHQIFNEPWDSTKIKLEKLIYAGVTSIRNMAGRVPSYQEWSEKIKSEKLVGPNIYTSALFAGQEFFDVDVRLQKYRDFGDDPGNENWMQIIDEKTNIPKAVELAKKSGATGIKLYANLRPEWVDEIIKESKKRELRVWGHSHLEYTETIELVDFGINSISHCAYLSKTIDDSDRVIRQYDVIDSARLNAVFESMKSNEVFFDATLKYFMQFNHPAGERFCKQVVNMADQKGVSIVTGSDSEGFWDNGNIALYDEIIILVEEANMSPISVLKSATYNPARLLGIEDQYGSVTKGKKADLVVFNNSPLEDIKNISKIYLTVKNGIIYHNGVDTDRANE